MGGVRDDAQASVVTNERVSNTDCPKPERRNLRLYAAQLGYRDQLRTQWVILGCSPPLCAAGRPPDREHAPPARRAGVAVVAGGRSGGELCIGGVEGGVALELPAHASPSALRIERRSRPRSRCPTSGRDARRGARASTTTTATPAKSPTTRVLSAGRGNPRPTSRNRRQKGGRGVFRPDLAPLHGTDKAETRPQQAVRGLVARTETTTISARVRRTTRTRCTTD